MQHRFEAPLHDDEYVTPGTRINGDVRVPDVPVPLGLSDVAESRATDAHEADVRTRFETPVERTPAEVAFRHVFHTVRRDWERKLASLQARAEDTNVSIDLRALEAQMHTDDATITAALMEAHASRGSNEDRLGAYREGVIEQRARMLVVFRAARAMLHLQHVRPDDDTAPMRNVGSLLP